MKKLIKRKIERLKTGWYIWLFPIFALGIASWLLYDYYRQQGPRITIAFDDASGVQVERTTVRYRGVAIGTVMDVYISKDEGDVIAEVLLRKDAARFAVEGSTFSLVTPKVNFQGITGLSTLLEGPYIAVLPGPKEARKKKHFNSQASLSLDPHDDTSAFLVETPNAESLTPGDAVTYRGLKIGTISKLLLDREGQDVLLQLNIENRFVRLIRTNTQFWRKPGIQAKIGLFKSEIRVNSLETIMNGGVELATPEPAGPRAPALNKFSLLEEIPKDYEKWRPLLGWKNMRYGDPEPQNESTDVDSDML